jgi:serine/threonine protein kinase
MAADRISGEVLWSRRIDSDIAAIYGIGKDRRWVSLETFDVPSDRYLGLDRTPPKNVVGVSTSVSEGIIPFGARNMESHRIGRHGSHSYVITKFDVGRNQFQLPSPDNIHNTLSNPGSRQLVAQHGRDHGIYKADDHLASTKPNLSSMSTLKRIEGLIPFGARQVESRNQLHRLGGHDSLVLINSPNMNNPDFHRSMQVAHGYHAAENLFPLKPVVDMSMIGVRPLPSHRTEHGLYLTWSMVSAVVIILLSVIVFFARLIILRQKRKWENISKLNQSAAASSEGGIRDGERIQPLQAQTLNTPSLGSVNGRSKKYLPVARSFSLGAIRTHSFSTRPMLTERGNSDLNGDSSTLPGASTPAMSPNTEKSKANSTDAILLDDKSRPGIDNIDGIPLVRYSRYTSEFKEILALGRGGFGTVFRCRNVLDGREYAIKKIRIASPLNSGDVTKHLSQKLHRVLREVKCLALLDHPNIVRYYTAWLEVDNGVHGDDDETNTISSMFDRSTLVSGFESFSRAMQQSFLPKRSKFQRPTEGRKDPSNPLGWNNFGSLRFEESKSESSTSLGARVADATKAVSIDDEEDDLGFTWERSKDNSAEQLLSVEKQPLEKLEVEGRHSSAISDCLENENDGAPSPLSRPATQLRSEAEKAAQLPQARCNGKASVGRHILFIQMQLCGVQTLADFLANHEARGGVVSQSSSDDSRYAVDVPFAIRLFAQIAHGVKYVHKQGLIHRDLKPQVSSSCLHNIDICVTYIFSHDCAMFRTASLMILGLLRLVTLDSVANLLQLVVSPISMRTTKILLSATIAFRH